MAEPENIPDAEIVGVIKTTTNIPALFNPSDNRIAEVKAKYLGLIARLPELIEADDPDPIKEALREIVPLRTAIDRCHRTIKEDALRFGQRVDAEKRRLHALVREFETPIANALEAIEDAARKRAEEKVRAQEALERQEREAKEAAERAIREAEENVRRAEREAAEKKLAEERAAFEAEKAKREAEDRARREQLEREEAEREAKRREQEAEIARQKAEVEAQAAKVRAELEAIEREKREKEIAERAAAEAKERAEREAKEAAERKERERIAAEEAERKRKEQEEADRRAELEARPDVDKIRGFGADLQMGIQAMAPELTPGTPAAIFVAEAIVDLGKIVDRLKGYTHRKRR